MGMISVVFLLIALDPQSGCCQRPGGLLDPAKADRYAVPVSLHENLKLQPLVGALFEGHLENFILAGEQKKVPHLLKSQLLKVVSRAEREYNLIY